MNDLLEISELDNQKTEIRVMQQCDISWSLDGTTYHAWVFRAAAGSVIYDWDSKRGTRRSYSARRPFPEVQYYPSREAS